MTTAAEIRRRPTPTVVIGGLALGSEHPVRVQAMTDTDSGDVVRTAAQIADLAQAGVEMVRITVNNSEAAAAVPAIRDQCRRLGVELPLIGDFHYNGHKLLQQHPDCAAALDKYRINPGNVGRGDSRDSQFASMIECAMRHDKPVRIGVNWGSLDQQLLAQRLDENASAPAAEQLGLEQLQRRVVVESALASAARAEELGLGHDRIVISCKMSRLWDLVAVYRDLAGRCDYPLHLGLTEAGMGDRGISVSSMALALILSEGIGDTIRVSLTPAPGDRRRREVEAAQLILQGLELRSFKPSVTACPGCGRTDSSYFRELADSIEGYLGQRMGEWRHSRPEAAALRVAVMGCVVNGPGESKHADIGISLPGTGEHPAAPVYIDGKKAVTLRGEGIAEQFRDLVDDYVERRFPPREG